MDENIIVHALEKQIESLKQELKKYKTSKNNIENFEKARFCQFLDNLPLIACIKNKKLENVYLNQYHKDFFDSHDMIGQKSQFLPDHLQKRLAIIAQKIFNKGIVQELIEMVPDKKGRLHALNGYLFPITTIDGAVSEIGIIVIDITHYMFMDDILCMANNCHKLVVDNHISNLLKSKHFINDEIKKQQKIKQSLEKKQSTISTLLNAPEYAAALLNCNGEFIEINKNAETLFNRSRDNLLGKSIFNFTSHDVTEKRKEQFEYAVQTGKSICFEGKQRNLYYRCNLFPVKEANNGKTVKVACYVRDITEIKDLQNRLMRSKRLVAAGQLATSIAHEINSPLQGIISLIYNIKQNYKEDNELIENLNLIHNAFCKIKNTVRHLMDMSRPMNVQKEKINVNDVIQQTVSLLKSHFKQKRFKVNLNLSNDIKPIIASEQQLSEVFINLFNNAIEAVDYNQNFRNLETQEKKIKGEIKVESKMDEDNIIIIVKDSGHGIAEKDLPHIFDPFFTKKKSIGIGIGLSVCNSIIENHKGTIEAQNSPEGGAVFTITIPICIPKISTIEMEQPF